MATVDAHSQPHDLAYRPDIDGLRGVAVLLVIVWHAGVNRLSGGFGGVDVFFVISGFVITGTLQRDAASGGVSILRFYARRLRRIAPAFLVMLAVVLAAGFVVEFPEQLKHTAKVALAGLALVANIALWRQGGYWGGDAATEPLRHIWSLSIEEQFYLVYPALLVCLMKVAPRWTGAVLATIATVSFAAFAYFSRGWGDTAYELGPMRAWELILGCLIALGARRLRLGAVACEALALFGAIGLAAASFNLLRMNPLVIVIDGFAAAALIVAGQRPTLVTRALASAPIRFVGLASYSLYLWHWPVLAFADSLQPTGVGALETAALVAAGGVLGLLSWRFVEQPFRRPWRGPADRARFLAGFGALAGVSAALATAALAGDGWPARFPPPVAALGRYAIFADTGDWKRQYRYPCFTNHPRLAADALPACLAAAPDRPNVLLWGDSHAGALAAPLAALTERLGGHLMQATMPGCPPFPELREVTPGCGRFDALVVAWLARHRPDVIILSSSTDYPLTGVGPRLDGLTSAGARVILVGPTPRYTIHPPQVLARAWPATPDLSPWVLPQSARIDRQLAALAATRPSVRYVSLMDVFCPAGRCQTYVAPGAPLVWDTNHLTPAAAQRAVSAGLAVPLAEALARRPAAPLPPPRASLR